MSMVRTHDMMSAVPDTVSSLKAALRGRGIFPGKRLGQSFLLDQNVLRSIVETAGICDRDIVLEIGTGAGSLTKHLGDRARKVLSVEIDRRLCDLSRAALDSCENVHIVNMDVLRSKAVIDPVIEGRLQEWLEGESGSVLKVVSNLPYCISTPAIIALLEGGLPVTLMVLTLQKEIVARLVAEPGTKEYGVLSVIAQLFSEIHVVRTLPAGVFWPAPQVESAVVTLNVDKEKAHRTAPDYKLLSTIVRTVFQSRRKTLLNSLLMLDLPSIDREVLPGVFKKLGIEPRLRGEALDLDEFVALSREISSLIH
ncbi:MAG: 16S rRNA (adenine(1518)-N(6)/adenine(1519)-N(6))-dimethyltransferase RsmA [Candidatus Brocadiales bacterium]|nr:16S rRNA (adenine(1518)-N(6)/adenine(1519)-N(6))-dimethyltransferase RsmA [Candidatus Bathyanammoxibius amoris]